MATYPSLVMAQQLAEVVKARLGTAYVVSQDANGDPTIAFGPGTTTTASAFVRIKVSRAPLGFDGIGHAQAQYGRPHKAEVQVEAAATSLGVLLNTTALLSTIVAELVRIGVRVEVYVTAAAATVPSLANLNTQLTNVAAGTDAVDAVWEDLYNPLTSTM